MLKSNDQADDLYVLQDKRIRGADKKLEAAQNMLRDIIQLANLRKRSHNEILEQLDNLRSDQQSIDIQPENNHLLTEFFKPVCILTLLALFSFNNFRF
jgi:hypothetical protein